MPDTSGSAGAGTAAVTNPAPARSAASAAIAGAPPCRPPIRSPAHHQHMPEVALVRRGLAWSLQQAHAPTPPTQIPSSETIAASGDPIGATTTG